MARRLVDSIRPVGNRFRRYAVVCRALPLCRHHDNLPVCETTSCGVPCSFAVLSLWRPAPRTTTQTPLRRCRIGARKDADPSRRVKHAAPSLATWILLTPPKRSRPPAPGGRPQGSPLRLFEGQESAGYHSRGAGSLLLISKANRRNRAAWTAGQGPIPTPLFSLTRENVTVPISCAGMQGRSNAVTTFATGC